MIFIRRKWRGKNVDQSVKYSGCDGRPDGTPGNGLSGAGGSLYN